MNRYVWILIGVIAAAGITLGIVMASRNDGPADPVIQGTTWQWARMRETMPAAQSVVPDPSHYTLTFNKDGTFQAQADCNQVSGSYTASNGQISIMLGPSTMAECGPESLYNTFVAKLAIADGYRLEANELILAFGAGAGELILKQ